MIKKEEKLMSAQEKQKVLGLLKSLETGDRQSVSSINPQKYIQHNLATGDGLQGFEALLESLAHASARVNTVRVYQDGAYVFTHTDYDFFGRKVGFDIFRFEDGKIVEHWDNLQEMAGPNPDGHSMTDGSITSQDLDKTDDNKALVLSFIEDMLLHGKTETRINYFDGNHYIQHNPLISDGLSGFDQAMEEWNRRGIIMKFDKVHQVLGEGNFVLIISEGTLGGQHTSFYDLFRVERAKIVEHWDTLEIIPAREAWKNNNGKF
jgi:predicted SnoaL-like aldol condensation-catalyzing enzyme